MDFESQTKERIFFPLVYKSTGMLLQVYQTKIQNCSRNCYNFGPTPLQKAKCMDVSFLMMILLKTTFLSISVQSLQQLETLGKYKNSVTFYRGISLSAAPQPPPSKSIPCG